LVIVVNELQKVLFQFPPGAMNALLEPAPGQDAEKAFGQIDPGGVGRSMVKVDLGMTPEPALGIFDRLHDGPTIRAARKPPKSHRADG
jgi:hypothetical protein